MAPAHDRPPLGVYINLTDEQVREVAQALLADARTGRSSSPSTPTNEPVGEPYDPLAPCTSCLKSMIQLLFNLEWSSSVSVNGGSTSIGACPSCGRPCSPYQIGAREVPAGHSGDCQLRAMMEECTELLSEVEAGTGTSNNQEEGQQGHST